MEENLIEIETANSMGRAEFINLMRQFFNSPNYTLSFIDEVENRRPFLNNLELYLEIITQLKRLPYRSQLEILKNQDELGSSKREEENEYAKIEHSSSGLSNLSDEHYYRFKYLNMAYRYKFGFNFLCVVAGLNSDQILSIFENRISNSPDIEFSIAMFQLEKLTFLRIKKRFYFSELAEDYFPQYKFNKMVS